MGPVAVLLGPGNATLCPAAAGLISSLLLKCMRTMRPRTTRVRECETADKTTRETAQYCGLRIEE